MGGTSRPASCRATTRTRGDSWPTSCCSTTRRARAGGHPQVSPRLRWQPCVLAAAAEAGLGPGRGRPVASEVDAWAARVCGACGMATRGKSGRVDDWRGDGIGGSGRGAADRPRTTDRSRRPVGMALTMEVGKKLKRDERLTSRPSSTSPYCPCRHAKSARQTGPTR